MSANSKLFGACPEGFVTRHCGGKEAFQKRYKTALQLKPMGYSRWGSFCQMGRQGGLIFTSLQSLLRLETLNCSWTQEKTSYRWALLYSNLLNSKLMLIWTVLKMTLPFLMCLSVCLIPNLLSSKELFHIKWQVWCECRCTFAGVQIHGGLVIFHLAQK